MSAAPVDLITGFFGFVFTLMVLSYLIGDNPLFRLAIYIFVGVSAGYAAVVAWYQVIWPRMFLPLVSGNFVTILLGTVPFFLCIMLLAKLSPRAARLGNPAVAFLVGVGAAVAIGGAVIGTILPQVGATVNLFDLERSGSLIERLFEGSIVLVGTATTLIYFHFGAKATPSGPVRNKWIAAFATVGKVFVGVTLGVLFAGAYAAAMTALIERIYFLWNYLFSFF
ncbi:MAG: hypothetical protein ABIJ39_11565 [Chloroflexota bacterium]